MMDILMGIYVILAVIVGLLTFISGCVGAVQAKSEITGRYKTDDARAIMALLLLGPTVVAPLWGPILVLGGVGWLGYNIHQLNKDAHLTELVGLSEFRENRKKVMEGQIRELTARNASLEAELEEREL